MYNRLSTFSHFSGHIIQRSKPHFACLPLLTTFSFFPTGFSSALLGALGVSNNGMPIYDHWLANPTAHLIFSAICKMPQFREALRNAIRSFITYQVSNQTYEFTSMIMFTVWLCELMANHTLLSLSQHSPDVLSCIYTAQQIN